MTSGVLRLGSYEVDLVRHEVRRPTVVALTPLEVALLRYLAERPGRAVHREDLLEHVWGWKRNLQTRAVFHAVQRLRKKIEPDPDHPRFLLAVFGVGYRLELADPSGVRLAPNDASNAERSRSAPRSASGLGERDAEWAAIEAAYAGGARVVTLVGAGGIGKTTLARAWHGRPRPDRARCWLSATDLRGAELAARAAVAVGVAEAADPDAALLEALPDAEVVLDDPDPAEAATFGPWLGHGRWLVTARQALDLAGEVVVHVGPLRVPPEGPGPLRTDLAAVALFVDVARRARPGLALGDADASTVHRVVASQGGHPLAVALAAARLCAVGLDDLLSAGPMADVLQATLARSLAALPTEARRALAVLAAVPGTLPLAGVAAVVDVGDPERVVEQLVLAGLVVVTEPSEAPREARYGLLPPVRSFALGAAAEVHAARLRWCRWLAGFGAPGATAALFGPGAIPARRRLLREAEGLATAAAFAFDHAPDAVGALVTACHHAAALEGPYPPAVALAERLLATADTPRARWMVGRGREWVGRPGGDELLASILDDPDAGAEAADELGVGCLRRGRTDEAIRLLRRAVEGLADRAGRQAVAWQHLGWALRIAGRYDAAREALGAAQATLDGDDHWLSAGLLLDLGAVDLAQGRSSAARERLTLAARRLAATGATRREAQARHLLSLLALDEGRWAEAEEACRAYLAVQRRLGDRRNQALALTNLGIVYGRLDRPLEAEDSFERAAAIGRTLGDERGEGFAWLNLGCLLSGRSERERARRALARAVELGRRVGVPRLLGAALTRLATVEPDPARARAAAEEAVALVPSLDPTNAALAHCARALLDPDRRAADLAVVDALLPSVPEPARGEVEDARRRAAG